MPEQLLMSIQVDKAAKPELAEGYSLRSYRKGDEKHWTRLMNGNIGEWDEEKARQELFLKAEFNPKAMFFVVEKASKTPVGTACLWSKPDDPPGVGWLHMVAVDNNHRGKHLGEVVSWAVVDAARKKGLKEVRLNTDDWRAGAVKTYLRMGFEPVLNVKGEDHTARWTALKKQLGFE